MRRSAPLFRRRIITIYSCLRVLILIVVNDYEYDTPGAVPGILGVLTVDLAYFGGHPPYILPHLSALASV